MTTATLSPLDAFLVDLLRAHGSPHAESTERLAARDARLAEIDRNFAIAMDAYRAHARAFPFRGQQFAPEPIPRVRMARTETRRPRRGLLRRAWEWVMQG